MIPRMRYNCNVMIVELSTGKRFISTGVPLFCFLRHLQCDLTQIMRTKKKAAIHERKISHGSAAFLFEAVMPSLRSEPHH